MVFKFFSEITGPIKPKFMWNQARKVNSTDSGHLLFFIIFSPGRAGAFSRDLTTILAPGSGALKIEKLKAR